MVQNLLPLSSGSPVRLWSRYFMQILVSIFLQTLPPAMRVFFPDHAVSGRSGLCIGWRDDHVQTVCILAVVHLPFDPQEILRHMRVCGEKSLKFWHF